MTLWGSENQETWRWLPGPLEACADIVAAIQREKTMKHWVRKWKLNAIEAFYPEWRDLWPELAS